MNAAQDGAEQRTAPNPATLVLDTFVSETPAAIITVVIASNRQDLRVAWCSMLATATDIDPLRTSHGRG